VGWLDALRCRRHPHRVTTIDLDDMELTEAARGQRRLADQAREDANRQAGSSSRAIFERSIKYHEALATKFEQARKSGDSRK
jgi:hypothetical protein